MFDKMKSMVWQDDSKLSKPQTPVQKPSGLQMPQPLQQPDPVSIDSVLDVAQVSAAIEALIVSNPAFADVITFQSKADALAAVITDEATRFKAASATSGMTKEQVILSVASAQQVLVDEAANFESSFVSANEANIQMLNNNSLALTQEIDNLTTHLSELSEQKNAVQKESVSKVAELAKAKIDFVSVTQSLNNKYTQLAGKFQQYL
jgi:hypothetical protein